MTVALFSASLGRLYSLELNIFCVSESVSFTSNSPLFSDALICVT